MPHAPSRRPLGRRPPIALGALPVVCWPALHIQNANNLHSRFKDWLRRFNGVSTTRLPLYVAWFNRIIQIEAEGDPREAALRKMLAT